MADRLAGTEAFLPIGAVNVGRTERVISGAIGAVLLGAGLRRRSGAGAGLALLGGVLLARGVTGHCPIYQAVSPHRQYGEASRQALKNPEHCEDRAPAVAETIGGPHPVQSVGTRDDDSREVELASEQSFPASDPPSFTPGAT